MKREKVEDLDSHKEGTCKTQVLEQDSSTRQSQQEEVEKGSMKTTELEVQDHDCKENPLQETCPCHREDLFPRRRMTCSPASCETALSLTCYLYKVLERCLACRLAQRTHEAEVLPESEPGAGTLSRGHRITTRGASRFPAGASEVIRGTRERNQARCFARGRML